MLIVSNKEKKVDHNIGFLSAKKVKWKRFKEVFHFLHFPDQYETSSPHPTLHGKSDGYRLVISVNAIDMILDKK